MRDLKVRRIMPVAIALWGCTPNFSGEYDGQAEVSWGPNHVDQLMAMGKDTTFPIHVSVGANSFVVTGKPIDSCSPKVREVSRKYGMMLDFSEGACRINIKGVATALDDGAGTATLSGDKLELYFTGHDLLHITANRKK